MTAWYNEIDKGAAEWLRELIKAGLIAPGDVDERSIEDVRPADLRGYAQCHFFAGIGGWSLALRLAGWPDDRQVWTGSCPCQPFSAAGKGDGFADERHLWPAWHHLIRECRPATVFGEQVASKDGLKWLDLVQADMEGEDYAIGAGDLCSAGFGAPHIRQRLGFVADDLRSSAGGMANSIGERGRRRESWSEDAGHARITGKDGRMAYANGRDPGAEWEQPGRQHGQQSQDRGVGGMADSECDGQHGCGNAGATRRDEPSNGGSFAGPMPTNDFWRDADWLLCTDGRWRPVEPGTFPLAHGVPGRVGLLRGYGNAINPRQFAAFIEAYLEREVIDLPPRAPTLLDLMEAAQ